MKHAAIFTRLAQRADLNIPILEAAMDEIAALEAELKERDLQLRHLLCIIHRDGGHHTQAHGLEQSIEDAKEKFFDLRDLPATIAQQAEQLAAAEKDAERLDWLDSLCDRTDETLPKMRHINSDMHFASNRVFICLRDCYGHAAKTGSASTAREAIDAAIAASKEKTNEGQPGRENA